MTLFLFEILTLTLFFVFIKLHKDNLVYIKAAIHLPLYGYLSFQLVLWVPSDKKTQMTGRLKLQEDT